MGINLRGDSEVFSPRRHREWSVLMAGYSVGWSSAELLQEAVCANQIKPDIRRNEEPCRGMSRSAQMFEFEDLMNPILLSSKFGGF